MTMIDKLRNMLYVLLVTIAAFLRDGNNRTDMYMQQRVNDDVCRRAHARH